MTWSGRLHLLPRMLLYAGPGSRAERHAHHAVQVMVGLQRPLRVSTTEDRVSRLVCIASGAEHAVDANETEVLLLLIEPESPEGRALSIAQPPREDDALLELRALLDKQAGAPQIASRMLAMFGTNEHRPTALHPSLKMALRCLQQTGARSELRRADVAAAARISPDRLSHLFDEQLGIPFQRYALWVRLKRAATAALSGASLTEAAHTAGFADGAHLSRTFRRMFGLPPSLVLPRLQIEDDET